MVPMNLYIYICVTLIGNFTLCVTRHIVKANAKNAPYPVLKVYTMPRDFQQLYVLNLINLHSQIPY